MKKTSSDSTYATWHDPSTYDPLTMGPPYLPTPKAPKPVQAKVAQMGLYRNPSGEGATFSFRVETPPSRPVGSLVASLRALSFLHQTHHWQTSGPNFYSDHKLLDQIYSETVDLVDPFAEKLVGLLGAEEVDLTMQFNCMGDFLSELAQSAKPQPSADDRMAQSLRGIQNYLKLMQEVYTQLKGTEKLTPGLDNLLQGVADKMEGFAYLLQQRLGTQYGYSR